MEQNSENQLIQTQGSNRISIHNSKEIEKIDEDLIEMPVCIERSLLSVIRFSLLQIIDKKMLPDKPFLSTSDLEKDFQNELLYLRDYSQKNELFNAGIIEFVDSIEKKIKSENWKLVVEETRSFLRKIRPLDIQEIVRLVSKTKEAADLIKNEDIILFVGETGAGKSTTIHYLAGSEMGKKKVELSSGKLLDHIEPIGEIKNPALRNVTCSPFAVSETRYITVVPVNLAELKGTGAPLTGMVNLCDVPGFGDTNGAEVEIANAVGLMKAIKQCKSVKPVILVSLKDIGSRGTGIKKLAHILVRMVSGIEDTLSTFSYFFTNFGADDNINSFLQNVRQSIEEKEDEKSDKAFVALIDDMLDKTENNAININPLDNEPKKIIKELKRSSSINSPGKVFQSSLAEESMHILQDQISKHQSSIIAASKFADYQLVNYKLNQLKYLDDLLNRDFVHQKYEECIYDVKQSIDEKFSEAQDLLNTYLENKNSLNLDIVKKYKSIVQQIEATKQLRETHLGKNTVQASTLLQGLITKIDDISKDLNDADMEDYKTKIQADNIKLLVDHIEEIAPKYKQISDHFTSRVDNLICLASRHIKQNDFPKALDNIRLAYKAASTLEEHLKCPEKEEMKSTFSETFIKHLEKEVDDLLPMFSKENFEKESLKICLTSLDSINELAGLGEYVKLPELKLVKEKLMSHIKNYFERISNKINEIYEQDTENSFRVMEKYFEVMSSIHEIPGAMVVTAGIYHSTKEAIISKIRNSRDDAIQLLDAVLQEKHDIDYDKLFKCLSGIEYARWIERVCPGLCDQISKDIHDRLVHFARRKCQKVMEQDLDLENFNNIESACKHVEQLEALNQLDEIIPNFKRYREQAYKRFSGAITLVFTQITKEISSNNDGIERLDGQTLENALKYLEKCKKVFILKEKASNLLTSLKIFLEKHSKLIQEEIESCFNKLSKRKSTEKDKYVNQISRRLKELAEYKRKFPRIFEKVDGEKILEEWQTHLENHLLSLDGEMNEYASSQQTQMLKVKVEIAKLLSQLDPFLTGNKKYSNLYQTFQKKLHEQFGEFYNQMQKYIEIHDYGNLAAGLVMRSDDASTQKVMNQIISSLRASVTKLIQDTKIEVIMLSKNLEKDTIMSLIENLKKIENAKKHVALHLEEIDLNLEEIFVPLSEKIIGFIDILEAMANVNDFDEAEKKKDHINCILKLLGKFLSKKEVTNRMEKLEDLFENIRKQVVDQYSKMSLDDYIFHPPKEILDKLQKVVGWNSKYQEVMNQIKQNILSNFEKELQKAKKCKDSRNAYIQVCESALLSLPETMKGPLEKKLEYFKADIALRDERNEKQLNKALEQEDVKVLSEMVEEFEKDNIKFWLSTLREEVGKKVRDISKKITDNIDNNYLKAVFHEAKRLYDFEKSLGKHIPEVTKRFLEAENTLSKLFNKSYNCLKDASAIESQETVEKSLDMFMSFIEFQNDFKNVAEEMISRDLDDKRLSLIETIDHQISKNSKKFDEALASKNLPNLLDALNTAKKCEILKKISNRKLSNDSKTYSEMVNVFSTFLANIKKEIEIFEFGANDSLRTEKFREEFYKNLSSNTDFLQQAGRKLKEHADNEIINLTSIDQDCLRVLKIKVEEASKNIMDTLTKPNLNIRECDQFRSLYDNLVSFGKYFCFLETEARMKIKGINSDMKNKIKELQEQAKIPDSGYKNITENLITMKFLSDNIPAFKQEIDEEIDKTLFQFKKGSGPLALPILCTKLQEEITGTGLSIISEHKIFKGEANRLWVEKTQKHDVEYILRKLDGDNVDKHSLRDLYGEFQKKYKNLVETYSTRIERTDSKALDGLISEIKFIAGNVKHKPNTVNWNLSVRQKVPDLISQIFAFWTLKNTQFYYEMKGTSSSERDFYLLKPHAAQVISLFRILGFGYTTDDKMINNLVQIGTGEGKSVTLAVTACVLALLGIDVNCACYSEYLSQRDYEEFLPIFNALGLLDQIHYGTFNKLCENIINEDGIVRDRVLNLISTNTLTPTVKLTYSTVQRPRVLLIDEVDVFFNKEFYGKLYTPTAVLKDPTISALIKFIWSNKSSNLKLKGIKDTAEFKDCCARFVGWEFLIEEAVKDMLADIKSFQSHDYLVHDGKIAYKEQDGISYDVIYGYKTLFAYYQEHEKGNVSRETLEENLNIVIHCGSFSYAEIPYRFQYIMGVTGTLKTLSDPEKEIIKSDYKIQKNTYVPSVFGENNRKFKKEDDITIEKKEDYFMKIRDEIDKRLEGRTDGTKRAVMVFFESKEKLMEFYNSPDSPDLVPIQERVQVMTEEINLKEKEAMIKRATVSDQITLLTRVFGRGTDFVCRNKTVLNNGGVHVIQTFLSEELSEEIQIMGRTARQGEEGSYSMVLLGEDLEKFLISREELEKLKAKKDVYSVLNPKRNSFFKEQYATCKLSVDEAKKKHEIAQKFLESLNSGKIDLIKKNLLQENKSIEAIANSRTICLMDATGSMGHLLQKAKISVETMFERAIEILKDNGLDLSFQLQFVVYRDYDCFVEEILQASPWETKPDNLRVFMDKIPAKGGGDYEEAIEIGLWHANQEHLKDPISQVILIGDAPAKTPEQIQEYRDKYKGEKYWKSSKFGPATDYIKETDRLMNEEIAVHTFYVDEGARTNFEDIAGRTGGMCKPLDVNSPSGAKELTDAVTQMILMNIGQLNGKGDSLLTAYQDKFIRGNK